MRYESSKPDSNGRMRVLEIPPEESAEGGLTPWQRRILVGIGVICVILAVEMPIQFLTGLVSLFTCLYSIKLVEQIRIVADIWTNRELPSISQEQMDELRFSSKPLPRFTILVPVYQEGAETIRRSIRAMYDLEYPKNLYRVYYLVEKDDGFTEKRILDEMKKMARAENFHIFSVFKVPSGGPPNKPNALNFALVEIDELGDYLGIYDAEDKPDTDQLLKVAYTFQHSPEKVYCVQNKLAYKPVKRSVLTQLFTIEYGMWFEKYLKFYS